MERKKEEKKHKATFPKVARKRRRQDKSKSIFANLGNIENDTFERQRKFKLKDGMEYHKHDKRQGYFGLYGKFVRAILEGKTQSQMNTKGGGIHKTHKHSHFIFL